MSCLWRAYVLGFSRRGWRCEGTADAALDRVPAPLRWAAYTRLVAR